MENIKIAVDVDGVILDLIGFFLKLHNEKKGTNVTINEWNRWDYHKELGFTDKEAYTLYHEIQEKYVMELPLIDPNTPDYLKDMTQNFVVDIVTARNKDYVKILKEKLRILGILPEVHYRKIVAVPDHPSFVKLEYPYDLYIDDNPNLAKKIKDYPHKILILYQQPWNVNIPSFVTGIDGCWAKNWQEVLQNVYRYSEINIKETEKCDECD